MGIFGSTWSARTEEKGRKDTEENVRVDKWERTAGHTAKKKERNLMWKCSTEQATWHQRVGTLKGGRKKIGRV